jgi:hypothetical protein
MGFWVLVLTSSVTAVAELRIADYYYYYLFDVIMKRKCYYQCFL